MPRGELTKDMIQKAGEMELLTYLQNFEPENLVRFSGDTWTTREHDSLKISNGKWMWWSRGIGGHNALTYLIKVKEMPFAEAVRTLLQKQPEYTEAVHDTYIHSVSGLNEAPKKPELPKKSPNERRVFAYLIRRRKIDREIVADCVKKGLIYESLPYHNAVFIGYDDRGEIAYAACRAANDTRFMGDAYGSDKRFAFKLSAAGGQPGSNKVHIFECAIDALSYATLVKMNGGDWRKLNLLSLGGVAPAKNEQAAQNQSKIPAALEQYLRTHENTECIFLHLDNDSAGRKASEAIRGQLAGKYRVIDNPVPSGKDVNEFLCEKSGDEHRTESMNGLCGGKPTANTR